MAKKILSLVVYSTLTADQRYTNWAKGGGDLPVPVGEVYVKGGANVADGRIHTPKGVATMISEDDEKILRTNDDFLLHEKNGFVQISKERVDPDKAAGDLTDKDASAPLTPGALGAGNDPSLVVTDGKGGVVKGTDRSTAG